MKEKNQEKWEAPSLVRPWDMWSYDWSLQQSKAMTGHSNDLSFEQRIVCQSIILTWCRDSAAVKPRDSPEQTFQYYQS